MELTHDDVLQILKLLEASDVDYLEVKLGDMRVVASKSGVLPGPEAGGGVQSAVAPPPPPPDAATAPALAPGAPPAGAGAAVEQDEGLVTVPAPVVGVFYSAPEPAAPPFVTVGSHVEADATMGLIEVMKVFNSVNAGVTGEVVQILVGNDEFVEFGQPLFVLRPDSA